MLVEYFNSPKIILDELDKKLADGWFRSGYMLFRSQIICIEAEVASVVNVRLPLKGYEMHKRMRKRFRRNNRLFRHEVSEFYIDDELNRLYKHQRERFIGFLYESLNDLFGHKEHLTDGIPFNTKMLRVYDEDNRLVAASVFDLGQKSIASILGVFDPDYGKYSLGIYTMQLEVEYAIAHGFEYYYPGYILDTPSVFDYKLRLGEEQLEFYDWKSKWHPWATFKPNSTGGYFLRNLLNQMEQALTYADIPYKKRVYVAFPAGYFPGMEGMLRCPMYFACGPYHNEEFQEVIIGYSWEEQKFVLMIVENLVLLDVAGIEISEEWRESDEYCTDLIDIQEVIAKGNPSTIIEAMRRNGLV